ncbi:MAG: tetratricopeptide repeat protein, partial [Thermoguttaceae bacterium]|nr:tetratricopeptide repeat protein [Thermoguttaceae bacterium]
EAGKKISDLMMEQTIQKVQSNKGGAKEPVEADDPKAGLTVEDQCEKRIKKDPKDREAYLELADYSFQRGNYRKVEDAYRRALREFPDDPAFSLGLLEIQRTRAREDYNRAKTIYDKNPSDDMKEKLQKQKADLDQKSLALIQAKLVQSPDSSQLHFELGQFLMKHGQSKEAITEFQAAKADVSMKGDCLLALAQCFQHIKQYRLAMSHYEQAIASLAEGESLKQALYLATRLACGLNKFDEADDFANRLAAIDFSYKDIGDLLDKIAEKRHN